MRACTAVEQKKRIRPSIQEVSRPDSTGRECALAGTAERFGTIRTKAVVVESGHGG